MKLTPFELRLLRHAERCSAEYDGVSPTGANEFRACRRLEGHGLLTWVGSGECGDGCERAGCCPHQVQIFAVTDAGRKHLLDLDEVRP